MFTIILVISVTNAILTVFPVILIGKGLKENSYVYFLTGVMLISCVAVLVVLDGKEGYSNELARAIASLTNLAGIIGVIMYSIHLAKHNKKPL